MDLKIVINFNRNEKKKKIILQYTHDIHVSHYAMERNRFIVISLKVMLLFTLIDVSNPPSPAVKKKKKNESPNQRWKFGDGALVPPTTGT